MYVRQNLFSGRRKYLFVFTLLSISLICVAFSLDDSGSFSTARREVLLRMIGHEVLLQSGDSTSRVLPVKKIGENEYLIRFENELTFQPEGLVNITKKVLADVPNAGDHIIQVLNCNSSTVAYGYAISNNKKDEIVPCKGREQPRACYMISVKFESEGMVTARNGYMLGGVVLLALLALAFLKRGRSGKALAENNERDTQNVSQGLSKAESGQYESLETTDEPLTEVSPSDRDSGVFTLGSILFNSESRKLVKDGTTTDLTVTENRVLIIFAMSPNQVIERSRLQKEIWEDEGVIVGRSLDMFISKLRKKLESDPNIRIAVIRGKGYRLEIGSV